MLFLFTGSVSEIDIASTLCHLFFSNTSRMYEFAMVLFATLLIEVFLGNLGSRLGFVSF